MIARAACLRWTLLATLGGVVGCSEAAPTGSTDPAPIPIEVLPADGTLPRGMEELVYGGRRGCRADSECASSQCLYGSCVGLIIADEPWRQRAVAAKIAERSKVDPELAKRVTQALATLLGRDDADQAFRSRAARGLEALGAHDALRAALDAAPGAVHEDLSLALMRLGDPVGIDVVIQLVESERTSLQLDAIYALGNLKNTSDIAQGLPVLLSFLTGDLGPEQPRAALGAIEQLGDPRAIRPLVAFVATGPEALADRASAVLRKLTHAELGPTALGWEDWVAKNNPPAPPAFTLRTHSSQDDIGLPPP